MHEQLTPDQRQQWLRDMLDKIRSQDATKRDAQYPPVEPMRPVPMPQPQQPPPVRLASSYIAPGIDPQEARYYTPGGMATVAGGGSAMFGKGLQMAKDFSPDLRGLYEGSWDDLVAWAKRIEEHYKAGARSAAAIEFAPTMTHGGMVPDPSAWDRVINAAGGMNSPQVRRMLGFGQ